MKRVLIIRSGAVGDLVLTLPVLTALKQRYEGLSIDMMGDPVRLSLFKSCGHIENVLPIDSRDVTPLFSSHASPVDGPARRSLQSYDTIISYLPDPDGVFTGNLRRIATGPVLACQAQPNRDDVANRTHMTHVLMKALGPLGMEPVAEAPALSIPVSVGSEVSSTPYPDKPLVAVHPGSGSLAKNWPAERFMALIDLLVDRDYDPVIAFGPADGEVRNRIVPSINDIRVRIADELSLVDLVVLLSRCTGMVGNDSGITHLAAALGVPAVALFGPTDPAVWGPRGKTVRILWGSETIAGDVGATARADEFRARRLTDVTLESVMNELAACKHRLKG